jgi:two-component system sensor histidine kinase KdpD
MAMKGEGGRHTVFLGMAPGVGKTYQMLEEGREERSRGRDVVIGYLEPHGRAETLAQADGLETLPRRRIEYRGATLEEMDLPGILRRRPELCLIDELAHTNVPGTEHDHRHEDVGAILDAGIDVWSTVNVQHVESLAGQIAALTGDRVSETLPDRMLDGAYNIVLVDLTPELLIERLEAGKIYPDDSADVARRNFFRPERLETLREVSLLQVAEEVEHGRGATSRPDVQVHPRRTPSPDRVLALAMPEPSTRPTVYHAYHTAQRLTAPFDVLWVPAQHQEAVASRDEGDLAALRRLVTTLGGTLIIRHGRDLVATVAEVAAQRGTTYLVMGRPQRRTPLGALAHRQLPLQLMHALPDVDVQIVALRDGPQA